MFFSEGQACPVCQKPFEKTDDIVVCPVCGAPHHRACYSEVGHCHFEADHGTANQWSRANADTAKSADNAESPAPPTDTRRCPHCGFENPAFAEFCGRCGKLTEQPHSEDEPRTSPPFGGMPFSGSFREFTYAPLHATVQNTAGVDPEVEIGGETAADVARVVARNERYYLPTFFDFEKTGKTVKWNWAAFFFSPFWLLYRKCHLIGGLTLLFSLLQQVLLNYVEIVKLGLFDGGADYAAVMERIEACMQNDSLHRYFLLISAISLISFLVHVFFGLFGNAIYEQACLAKIRTSKEKFGEGYRDMLPVIGGVSAGLALISYFVWYFLPLVLQGFLS